MSRHAQINPVLLRDLADALDKDRGHSKSLLTRTMRDSADDLDKLREAVLAVADGELSDPCWCGDEWWAVHDLDEREHSEWCAQLRSLLLDGGA